MKKYMLISMCHREIDPPQFFETAEEAKAAMYSEFAQCMDMEVSEALEKYMNDEWEDDAQITEEYATASPHKELLAWQIFDLSTINRS